MSDRQKFNPEVVLQKINRLEEIFPVHEWEINEVKIWPFIRTSLAYTQNQNPNTKRPAKKQGRLNKIRQLAGILISAPFYFLKLRQKLKKATRVFVGASTHRINIGGVFINKYYDLAARDFANGGEQVVLLDSKRSRSNEGYMNSDSLFSLPALYMCAEIWKRLRLRKKPYPVSLSKYDEFYKHLLENFDYPAVLQKNFRKADVIKRSIALGERRDFFMKLLDGSPVQTVYFLCYYSSMLYPLIAACNATGIKTVDIQHGGIGAGHYSYDRWKSIPAGHPLLPRFFWTWDKHTAALINQWASATHYHRAIANGNPWAEDSLRVYNKIPAVKDYILINLTEIQLDDFVIETIFYFGDRQQWVLRMHPRQYHHRKVLEKQILEKGIGSYVTIEDSNSIPLAVSLNYCKLFLSKPSGSVIEAVEMGFKPLLLRSVILNYYSHYITGHKVWLLEEDTAGNLIRIISEIQGHHRPPLAVPKAESSDKFHTFERLIKP